MNARSQQGHMTDEQRDLLDRRLKEAAEEQPEIIAFRSLLLKIGGDELVPPPSLDREVPVLIANGSIMNGVVTFIPIEEGRCHENVAELWREKKAGIVGIGVGYALSEDGLWRQHSWGIRDDGEIIETTAARVHYFGRLLRGVEGDEFAETNKGDPEERYWRRLPEVFFRLTKDEDGYPPRDWEGLKAEPTTEPDTYRIKSVPFFVRNVAYHDEVRTGTSEEGYFPVYASVSKRSGFSVIRLIINESEDRTALTEYFASRGCLVEFKGRLVAIAIPRSVYREISEYVCREKDGGRWDAEDGHLAIDDQLIDTIANKEL